MYCKWSTFLKALRVDKAHVTLLVGKFRLQYIKIKQLAGELRLQ